MCYHYNKYLYLSFQTQYGYCDKVDKVSADCNKINGSVPLVNFTVHVVRRGRLHISFSVISVSK